MTDETIETLKSDNEAMGKLLVKSAEENTRLRAENARLLKAIKGAYYEGYRDRHMFGDTDDPDDRNLWALSHTRDAMERRRHD